MSNYNFNNVNIVGDNNHIGDKYFSYDNFLKTHTNLDGSEREVIRTIFETDYIDIQKDKLLKSFEKIINNKNKKLRIDEGEKYLWKKFKEKLVDKGLVKAANAVEKILISVGIKIIDSI